MTSTQFHTMKERHVASLNTLLHTVSKNKEFLEETRNVFANECRQAIDCIFAQRGEVYRKLENHELKEAYDPEAPRFAGAKRIDIKPGATRGAHNAITQIIVDVAAQSKAIRVGDSVVNPMTNEKYVIGEEFLSSNKFLERCFEVMVSAIQKEDAHDAKVEAAPVVEEKKEDTIKHILNEDDFDENPELNNLGMSVGDEIEIPAPPADTIVTGDESKEAEPQAQPTSAATVVPTEEIQKQNEQETKAPRKRSSKSKK